MKNDSFYKKLLYKFIALLPDKFFLSLKYYKNFGRFPQWNNPKTFTEKLQWLKIYNRNPLYSTMVDKYDAKKYVANKIGGKYIIPTLGVWEKAEDIDFDSLPNQFVLKTTHDSGRIIICKNKSILEKENIIKILNESLKRNFHAITREWPYKNVKPQIIAEKYIDNNDQDLIDYKFYCFNGVATYCQVITNRTEVETIDFFDKNWIHLNFIGLNPKARHSLKTIEKPYNYSEMLKIAESLSKNCPFLRVDLYNINGNILFGELTFFPNSGVGKFTPKEWDWKLGELLILPKEKK